MESFRRLCTQVEQRCRLSWVHARKQPHVRNDDKLGQHRNWTSGNHKMTPQQRQAQFGNPWHVALTAAGGSKHDANASTSWTWTSSPRSIELSIGAAGASQAGSSCTQTRWPIFFLHRTRSRILRSERWVWNNRLTLKHITCYQWRDASKLFSASFVALPISHFFFWRGGFDHGWKQA